MGQYNKCLQITFILFQLLFIAFGAVLIGVGAWVGVTVSPTNYQAVVSATEFKAAPYVIVACGCIVIAIAAVGMFGACCSSVCNKILLGVYIIATLSILGLQLAGGIAGFVFRDKVQSIIQSRISNSNITSAYNASSSSIDAKAIVTAWNFIQQKFECCGVNGSADWKYGIPNSCCKSCASANFITGNCTTPVGCNPPPADGIYTVGCQTALVDFFKKYLIIVAAIAIAFIVSELVVVLMAFCLLCCSKAEKD
ncbi:hypothetical protein EMCRGX_G009033 [Ephydatia muelleri]|eukprot:Em0003g386a